MGAGMGHGGTWQFDGAGWAGGGGYEEDVGQTASLSRPWGQTSSLSYEQKERQDYPSLFLLVGLIHQTRKGRNFCGSGVCFYC